MTRTAPAAGSGAQAGDEKNGREMNKAFRHWVTFNDDEGRELVIQHNSDVEQIEIAWLTEGGELINGFWTMSAKTFIEQLRLDRVDD